MAKEQDIKEIKFNKFKFFIKVLQIIYNGVFKRNWTIPGVDEITTDQLYELFNSENPPILIDVRSRKEFYAAKGSYKEYGHIPESKSVPIMQLTDNLEILAPLKGREIVTMCPGGGMSLVAAEIMNKAGFEDVKSLRGGLDWWDKKGYPMTTEYNPEFPFEDKKSKSSERKFSAERYAGEVNSTVDARGESCPKPVLMSKKAITKMDIGHVLEILTTDPGSLSDIPAWANVTGQELVSKEENNPEEFRFIVRKQK